MIKVGLSLLLLISTFSFAAEHQIHGLLDARYTYTDSLPTYLNGDFGKFRFDESANISLAQVALTYNGEFEHNLSLHLIGNGYVGGANDDFGITEAYAQYKSLPSLNGFRLQVRAGIIYPKVSIENIQTGWSSPYTLNYSTINAWIGEEVRHKGLDFSVTKLGIFNGSEHDFTVSFSFLRGNDPTGAMIAWHGWVSSSRQSLWGETLPLPDIGPRFVPAESDPFIELDHRTGYHGTFQWDWQSKVKFLGGLYHNNADPKVVEDGQWAWTTRFVHLGLQWRLPADIELLTQYLLGDTLMESSRSGRDLVFNEFHSAYVMLSKKINKHRLTARIEEFAVIDNDTIGSDLNAEYGKALTLNYSYRYNRNWFGHVEYNWVASDRDARVNFNQSYHQIENQWQFAIRYYF